MVLRAACVRLFVLPALFVAMGGNLGWGAPRTGAPEVDIQSWTFRDGLPDERITSIQQTAEGFLWVGTEQGLARFDGWTFVPVAIQSTPGASAGITPVRVTAQCVDAQNQLWFGTESQGLFRLSASTGSLHAVSAGLAGERVFCLGSDESGTVWIGTEKGLVRQQGGVFTRIAAEPGVTDPTVLGLQVTRSNGVWVTTRAGLRKYQEGKMLRGAFDPEASGQKAPFLGVFEDRAGSLWGFGDTYLLNLSENRRFNYFRGGGATQLQVWSICEGRAGQLWIGTSGQGLFYFGGSRFYAVDLREGRDHSDVRTVFADREGQLWVGTQRGLVRLREKVVRWFTGPGGAATCLAEDPDGRVWAGFEHGGMVSGRAGVLEMPGATAPLAGQNLISTLYARGDGSLWVGTLGTGMYRIKDGRAMHYSLAHGLSDDTILAVCGTTGGRVWVSTADGRLHRYLEHLVATFDQRNGLTGHPITAIARSRDGGLWLGTEQGEILRFQAERFQVLPQVPEFRGKRVTALREPVKNRLWAGTHGGGLACHAEGQWRVWKAETGLPDDQVIGVQESLSGEIWVATTKGVSRLPARAGAAGTNRTEQLPVLVEFSRERAEDGVGWPRSLRSRDGALWFATGNGVVSFQPEDLRLAAPASTVHLESVRANGELASWPLVRAAAGVKGSLMELPARLRDVEIGFTAPSLAHPERTRFRHKLEGFDPDWLDSTVTRRARYGRLPAGEYQFRVMASDAEGAWTGRETQLGLVVPAPLWRTPWAIALETLVLVTAVASVVRVVSHRRLRRQLARLEQQRAMERERARIAQDMHDELGAKLTKISYLSERARNDLDDASSTSKKLNSIAVTSQELMHSLDEIVWAVNPKNDTLEHLAAYLGQYAAEYLQNTTVDHELRIPGYLPDYALTAEVRHNLFLAFEEALGNALKHSGASRVRVAMAVEARGFIIQITDNGRGLQGSGGGDGNGPGQTGRRGAGGSGLRGMRDRLIRSGGQCEVRSQPGAGTTIELSIPLPAGERKLS